MNKTEYVPKYLGSYLEIGKCCDVAGFLQMKITLAIWSTVNLYKHLPTNILYILKCIKSKGYTVLPPN